MSKHSEFIQKCLDDPSSVSLKELQDNHDAIEAAHAATVKGAKADYHAAVDAAAYYAYSYAADNVDYAEYWAKSYEGPKEQGE